jgi:serine/threonine protein kinase
MQRPVSLGELTAEEQQELERLLNRFERACQTGSAPDLRAFLPVQDRLYLVALQELIKIELEVHWRRREPVKIEEYLVRFPELAGAPQVWPALLYEEYFVRHNHGDKPPPSEYRQRFPSAYASFARMIQNQPRSVSGQRAGPGSGPRPPSWPSGPGGGPGSVPDHLLAVGEGYQLLERIGCGAFGEVWKALAPGGIQVAVKILLRPMGDAEARREKEALDLIKNLRFPFLLQTYAYFPQSDRLVIVMELADGSLRDRLKECIKAGLQGIPAEELLKYARQASEALDFLHRNQVLHRDIKPDNILLQENHVKVADMGLARRQEGPGQFTATMAGSLAYMAPEVWSGHASTHSDQYSLAVSYVELRLGRMLFETRNMGELMLAALEKTPDLAPLPEAEQRVLLRALAKKPENRFPTCVAFADALHEALFPSPVHIDSSRGSVAAVASVVPRESEAAVGSAAVAVAPPAEPADMDLRRTLVGQTDTHPSIPPESSVARRPASGVAQWRPPVKPGGPKAGRRSWYRTAALLVVTGAVLGAASALAYREIWKRGTPPNPPEPPPPPPPQLVLVVPSGFEPAEEAAVKQAGGRLYYDRLVCKLGEDQPSWVYFRLLLRARPEFGASIVGLLGSPSGHAPLLAASLTHGQAEPFYLMEHKVTNHQFRLFAQGPLPKSPWERGGVRDGKDLQVGPDRDLWPVYRVSLEDAHRFALWMERDHGSPQWRLELPTKVQWLLASGLSVNYLGPVAPEQPVPPGFALQYRQHPEASGPCPVEPCDRDIAPGSKCQNLFSNGWEWTRTRYIEDTNLDLRQGAPPQGATMRLMGQTYLADRPFTLRYTGDPPDFDSETLDANPEISFRLVLEPVNP